MNPLLYLKAVIGAVGANVFPPIADWVVTFIPAPGPVRTALSILLVALLTDEPVVSVCSFVGCDDVSVYPCLAFRHQRL